MAVGSFPQETSPLYGVRVYRNATQTLTTGVPTNVLFDSENFDTHSLHDTTTNTDRILLNKIGIWLVQGGVTYDINANGARQAAIRINGSTYSSYQYMPASSVGGFFIQTHSLIKTTTTTDYVILEAYQTSGGNLNLVAGVGRTWMSAVWLGA